METRNEYSGKGTICLWVFSLTLSLIWIIYLSFNTVKAMERGPQHVFSVAFGIILFLLIGIISLLTWIAKKFGKEKRNKTIKVLVLCTFLLFAYFSWEGYQIRKDYYTIDVGGVERQYRMYFPSNYSASNPDLPVLFALHGGGGSAHQFENQAGFNTVAEQYNFIVVYPDGVGMTRNAGHVWNSGYLDSGLKYGMNDVEFLTSLIGYLGDLYKIDPSRVYMTGHSNGGMMTYRMAGEKPELFAAVAPTSAPIGGKANDSSDLYIIPTPDSPVSIVHFHGKQDLNVLYDGGYPESGFNVGVRFDMSVNESIEFWVENNGCDPSATQQFSENEKIRLDTYSNGLEGTSVRLVTLIEQNHFWENMNQEVVKEGFFGANSLAELIWILLTN